ncbi:hypothetical protein IWW36_002960 [Coemansia brasiliensis]|uniref:CDT1 Geminin-binding domain-containing protein n=1 Tax=Coemansia brasiliensis TaxID=2650707 RepID=A0A9W8ICJ2_9FUNG|nr:hypothetical protein IWW36_002960 [Coemansia brasiliensis]
MRGQQRGSTTLKSFVRVSKNAEGPVGKDVAKPTMRITRSRAAALAAEARAAEDKPIDPMPQLPTTPSRKRKLELTAEAAKAESSPAKRATRTPQKRTAAEKTTKKQRKPTTTIKSYFKPKDNESAAPKAVEPTTVEPSIEPDEAIPNSSSSKDNETAAEPNVSPPKAGRAERANSLLKRLRNRKRPEPTAIEQAKIEETRAIQDQIRALREQPAAECLVNPRLASFEASHIKTAEEQQLRELKRQFVKINSSVDGMAPMPREFRKLEELFQALEHTVMFGGANSKGVVYHRIRQAVESMAQRTFGWRELGQILAVYPESYSYKPFTTTHNGRSVQSVVLTPVARGMTLALEMESRRDQFKQRLIKLVSTAHTDFLLKRGYSEGEISGISGWHPSFDIETTPTITPLDLPPTALKDMQASGTVASFDREKLKHLLGSGRNVSKPVATAADPSASKLSSSSDEAKIAVLSLPTPTDSPVLQASGNKPKERPTSTAAALLERIRAKQRAKELAAKPKVIPVTTRSMYSRLPVILSTLSFIYYSERKHVLPLAYVVDKVCESQNLDKSEATCHLVSLAEFIPEWCLVDDNDPKKPSPDARFKVIRSISTQEAKKRLQTKIDAIEQA